MRPGEYSSHKEGIVVDRVALDPAFGLVWVNGRRILLSPREADLLYHLMAKAGRVVPPEELLTQALGYPPNWGNRRTVTSHVYNIRRKIEPDPRHPRYLLTRPHWGYVMPVDSG